MRVPLPTVLAGVLVAVVGAAGLVRGAQPLSAGGGGATSQSPPIVITGAYVRQPAPPTDAAAAYFTVYNTTDRADRLLSVISGAGRTATLHVVVGGQMVAAADGAVIPAHGRLVLSVGSGHVMIQQLFGPLTPGQTVNMLVTFANAGAVEVTAPVIALGAPAPTGSSTTPGATK